MKTSTAFAAGAAVAYVIVAVGRLARLFATFEPVTMHGGYDESFFCPMCDADAPVMLP